MITAGFYECPDGTLTGFKVSGHAFFADAGSDVCCASVSSAVMMAANTVTEIFEIPAEVEVSAEENYVELRLKEKDPDGPKLLAGLRLQLECIAEEFPGRVKVRTAKS